MQPALGLGLGTRINGFGGSFGGGFSIENSFYLDGVNQDFLIANADINPLVSGNTTYTLFGAFKRVDDTAFRMDLFGNGSGTNLNCNIRVLSNTTIYLYVTQLGVSRWAAVTGLPDMNNRWVIFAITFSSSDPSKCKFYVDGVDAGGGSINLSIDDVDTKAGNYTIGQLGNGAAYFRGNISMLGIVPSIISLEQYQYWYNGGKPKNPQTVFGETTRFYNPDTSGDTAQFTMTDSLNSTSATSRNLVDSYKTPITPYTDPLQRIIDKYATLNAWSFENFGINTTTSTIYDYEGTHDLSNPAVANQPTFYGGDGNILNRPSAYFVTDDYLYKAQADYLIGESTGCIHAVFTTNANITSSNWVFSSCDAASTNYIFGVAVVLGKFRLLIRNTTGQEYDVYLSTEPQANTSYVISIYQNGTNIQAYVNGVAQTFTDNGSSGTTPEQMWWSDVSNRDNIAIGGAIISPSQYSDLDIALVQITSDSADATVLANHTELNDIYGCYLTAEAPLSIEKSFYFDGVDQYFNADSLVANVSSDTVGTMSVMVKHTANSPSGSAIICGFGDADAVTQLNINQQANGKVRASLSYVGTSQWVLDTDNAIDLTNWTKIDVVQNGIEPVLYINGIAVATTFIVFVNKTFWLNDMLNIDTFSIGALTYNSTQLFNFNGYISQVSYVNTNLSPQDIAYIYNGGDVRNIQTLLGNKCKFFWNPDNRTGDTAEFTVADSINSINATSVNFDDANLSPLTPYSDAIQTIIDKYATLNAWSFANIGINGTTTTAYDYEGTHDLSNPAVANQPTFVGGDANIDNYPSATFLTSEYLYKSTADYLSGQSTGCIHTVFTTNADVTTINRFVSSSDEATILYRIDMLILNGKLRFSMVNNTNSYIVDCDTTTLSGNTSYVVSAYQNGTTLQILINGVTQSLTVVGGTSQTYWFSDIPNRDNIVIGALIASSNFWSNLDLALVQITSDSDDATVLANHNELKTLYGI